MSGATAEKEAERSDFNVGVAVGVDGEEVGLRLRRRISMPTVTRCSFSPNITTPNTLIMDDKDALIKSLQGEIVSLQDVIKSRDNEIFKLRREIHKLKVIINGLAAR